MAFKGVLPSDLWLKYSKPYGKQLMELDINVALDISEKINAATKSTKGKNGLKAATKDDARGIVARRNERREARKKALNDT
jgi:hypothetical protein